MADSGYQGELASAASDGRRYGYADTPRFQLDVSPFAGGWTPVGDYTTATLGVPVVNYATLIEACVTPGSTAIMVMQYNLNQIIRENLTDAPGVIATLQKIHLRYYRNAAGDLIGLTLYSAPKVGGGYPVAEQALSEAAEFATTGAWTQYSSPADLAEALDVEANVYWLHLTMTNAAAKANCRAGVLLLDFDKTAVE